MKIIKSNILSKKVIEFRFGILDFFVCKYQKNFPDDNAFM